MNVVQLKLEFKMAVILRLRIEARRSKGVPRLIHERHEKEEKREEKNILHSFK